MKLQIWIELITKNGMGRSWQCLKSYLFPRVDSSKETSLHTHTQDSGIQILNPMNVSIYSKAKY